MTDRRDILISEIVGGAWSGHAFDELTTVSRDDPSVWRRLAEAQRDQASLERLLDDAVAVAESVETPTRGDREGLSWPDQSVRRRSIGPSHEAHRPWARWRSGAGWAVAALVLLAWSAGLRNPGGIGPVGAPAGSLAGSSVGGGTGEVSEAGLGGAFGSAKDAFQAYLDRGHAEGTVLSQEPQRVLLQSRPAAGGEGIEIIYVQQVMERAIVPSLYHFSGQDERGRPGMVRYRERERGRM